jgi:peptidoglycan hydrolase-like protein with peptidoglycan-binding domain
MKRLLCAAAAVSIAACFHATRVEKPDGEAGRSEQAAQPTKQEGGAAAKPHAARRPQKPGRPPLAASPAGLFVPGGVEKIQEALAAKGYLHLDSAKKGDVDAPTVAAVRKFQGDQGIARTGNPDHETVRRLGLDADSLFRKSAPLQGSETPGR